MANPPEDDSRIVASKLTPPKQHKSDNPDVPIPPGFPRDGFKYVYDGAEILLNDYPATGGPWIPGVQPNGQVVWINGAAL